MGDCIETPFGLQKSGFYKPLLNDEIRLIRLEQGSEPIISCRIIHVPLTHDPVFFALSYTWGTQGFTEKILVNDTPFPVTFNLFEALLEIRKQIRSLQDKRTIPLLWVDAICLDQSDDREESIEVPRMHLIYGKCERVLVWTGLVESEQEKAIKKVITKLQLFKAMADKSKKTVDAMVQAYSNSKSGPMASEHDKLLTSLKSIGMSPWFKRIWTVQETALATHDPIMLLGPNTFSFETYFSLRKGLEGKGPSSPEQDSTPYALCHSLVRGKRREISGFSFLSNSTELQRLGTAYEMLQLLQFTSALEATVPHDYIYGLLGLLRQHQLPYELIPRYQEPFELAYYDCVKYILSQTKELSVLSLGRLGVLNGIPSWVPDFRHKVSRAVSDETETADFKFLDRRTLSVSGIVLGKFRPEPLVVHNPSVANNSVNNVASKSKGKQRSDGVEGITARLDQTTLIYGIKSSVSVRMMGISAVDEFEESFNLRFTAMYDNPPQDNFNKHEAFLNSFMATYNRIFHNDSEDEYKDPTCPEQQHLTPDTERIPPRPANPLTTPTLTGQYVVYPYTPSTNTILPAHQQPTLLIVLLPHLPYALALQALNVEEQRLYSHNLHYLSGLGSDRVALIAWLLNARDTEAARLAGLEEPARRRPDFESHRRDLERVGTGLGEQDEVYRIVGQVEIGGGQGRNGFEEVRRRHGGVERFCIV